MLLVLIASLCENNELPMSTSNDNPDGFPLPKGTGMTGALRFFVDINFLEWYNLSLPFSTGGQWLTARPLTANYIRIFCRPLSVFCRPPTIAIEKIPMTIPVMAYPQLAPSEQATCRKQLDAGLAGLPADLASRASQLFDRLIPVQWPVEWHLPWWLGQEFDLPAPDIQTLTLCNLFGLGYVRLQDTILDERALQAERRNQGWLADALHDQAMRRLGDLFGDQAEFWRWRNEAMRQWQLALSDGEQAPACRFADWTESDLLLLAWRGAPIKITAVGACLLAGRSEAVPVLLDALDHMLIAQVLLDHLDDWSTDLDAGRFNAFVAFVSDLAQTARHRDANRRQVMQEFFLGDAGVSYVDLTRRHIQTALRYAEAVPCSGLGHYLASYDTRIAASELALRSRIRGWLHDASVALFALPQAMDSATTPS